MRRPATTIAACLGAIACRGGHGQAPAAPIGYESVSVDPPARPVAPEVPLCEHVTDLPVAAGGPAANSARGVIVDATGAPIEGAEVTITGRNRVSQGGHVVRIPGKTSTWTHDSGAFRFEALEPEMDDITVVVRGMTVTCKRDLQDDRGYVIRMVR